MIQTELTVPVFVLEASDVEDITDENRATGKLTGYVEKLEAKVHQEVGARVTVSVGFRSDPRAGTVPFVNIAGVKLNAGEAVAFLPTGPARIPVPEKPKAAPKAAKKTAKKTD